MFFGITDIWTYVIGAFLIILLPGPNSLYVLATAAQHGVRQGYRAATGVFVGDTVLMVLAAAGVASLLRSTPILFNLVKYAGAAYLAWVGFQMLRGAWRSWRAHGRPETAGAAPSTARAAPACSRWPSRPVRYSGDRSPGSMSSTRHWPALICMRRSDRGVIVTPYTRSTPSPADRASSRQL